MKVWKRALLLAASAVLLQAGTCATDFGYYLMQALASELVEQAVNAATSGT